MTANTIAVLPLGAQEYHGPHLPLETDTLIAAALAERVKAALPPAFPALFLPAEPVGYSVEHMRAPGTQTLAYQQAAEKWLAIAAAQHKNGINKLIMLNAHGGNGPIMALAAQEARARFNMLAVVTSFSRLGLPRGLLSAREQKLDIHGGFIETSVMLAIAPERVNMAKAQNFANAQAELERDFTLLRAYGKHSFGWLMADINRQGAAGAAARATAAAGERIMAYKTRRALKLFRDVEKFDLARLQ